MTEHRKRGWHPDPFGRHKERYYFADDQPGRLVRNEDRHEFYDDLPTEAEAAAPAGTASAPPPPSRAAAPSPVYQPPQPPLVAPRRPVRPAPEPIRPRSTLQGRVAELLGSLTDGRPPLVVAAVCALVLALIVTIVIVALPGSTPTSHNGATGSTGTHRSGAASATNNGSTTPGGRTDITSGVPVSAPTRWQVVGTFLNPIRTLNGVACATSTSCEAVGESDLRTGLVLSSDNAGVSWVQQSVPAEVGPLAAIACPSATSCIAVGGTTAIETANGGATWSLHPFGPGSLTSISCPSVDSCVAVAAAPQVGTGCPSSISYATANAGSSWTSSHINCVVASAIGCATPQICEMTGSASLTSSASSTVGTILGSADGGVTWQSQYSSSSAGGVLNGISCPTTQVCEAVGTASTGSLLGTIDGGHSWAVQSPPVPARERTFSAVTCETPTSCQAVGSAQPLATSTGGTHWFKLSAPATVDSMNAMACSSLDFCLAVGRGVSGNAVILKLI